MRKLAMILMAWTLLAILLSWILLLPHNNAPVAAMPHDAPVPLPKSPKELLCELKTSARLRTVDGSEEPFSSLGWSQLVPAAPLVTAGPLVPGLRGNRSCAVVSSAGAMLRSGLGEEIDSHEEVMRFNHAPTAGYEKDVGTRTTFRLINEQIQYKPVFQFGKNPLYRNVTLVTWEKAPHDLDLSEWYAHGKMFGPYVKRRRLDPAQPFYVLHPGYIRQLWQAIQWNVPQEHIQPNPPTSGFIGILVMMALCDEVHVYEYIPSVARQTELCHYFEDDRNIACSLGGKDYWHPLEFEKRLIRQINTGSETDLRRGRVTLPGFSVVNCDYRVTGSKLLRDRSIASGP